MEFLFIPSVKSLLKRGIVFFLMVCVCLDGQIFFKEIRKLRPGVDAVAQGMLARYPSPVASRYACKACENVILDRAPLLALILVVLAILFG